MVVLGYFCHTASITLCDWVLRTERLLLRVPLAACVLGEDLSGLAITERLVESSVIVEVHVALNSLA